jgi:putative sterol carrier protein
MAVKFGTLDFYKAMGDELNNDPEWAEKGKNLTYTMVYNYEAPIEGSFYVQFDQGRVTEVRDASAADSEAANFVISGSSDVWRGIFEKKINPTVALTRGQLRVRGKMAQLLKNMSAFQHVIVAMTRVDFE